MKCVIKREARRSYGAASMEYVLLLALVVLPLGLMLPLFLWMIRTYGTRIWDIIALPFP